MSHEKDPECRAVLIEETPLAIHVKPHLAKAPIKPSGATWWIPRSQIGYLRKDKVSDSLTHVVFTVPEWLIEAKQCWELVP